MYFRSINSSKICLLGKLSGLKSRYKTLFPMQKRGNLTMKTLIIKKEFGDVFLESCTQDYLSSFTFVQDEKDAFVKPKAHEPIHLTMELQLQEELKTMNNKLKYELTDSELTGLKNRAKSIIEKLSNNTLLSFNSDTLYEIINYYCKIAIIENKKETVEEINNMLSELIGNGYLLTNEFENRHIYLAVDTISKMGLSIEQKMKLIQNIKDMFNSVGVRFKYADQFMPMFDSLFPVFIDKGKMTGNLKHIDKATRLIPKIGIIEKYMRYDRVQYSQKLLETSLKILTMTDSYVEFYNRFKFIGLYNIMMDHKLVELMLNYYQYNSQNPQNALEIFSVIKQNSYDQNSDILGLMLKCICTSGNKPMLESFFKDYEKFIQKNVLKVAEIINQHPTMLSAENQHTITDLLENIKFEQEDTFHIFRVKLSFYVSSNKVRKALSCYTTYFQTKYKNKESGFPWKLNNNFYFSNKITITRNNNCKIIEGEDIWMTAEISKLYSKNNSSLGYTFLENVIDLAVFNTAKPVYFPFEALRALNHSIVNEENHIEAKGVLDKLGNINKWMRCTYDLVELMPLLQFYKLRRDIDYGTRNKETLDEAYMKLII